MDGQFQGAIAVVTGAGSGIGAATAHALGRRGASRVYVLDLDETGARTIAESVTGAVPVAVDVADPVQVADVFDTVIADTGRVDVVVHAAGVDDPVSKAWIQEAAESGDPVDVLSRLSDEAWRRVMAVNLDGTFHVLRESVRSMRGRGGGSVVTVGSSSAFDTLIGYPHYSASKAAVHALTQSVAKEVLLRDSGQHGGAGSGRHGDGRAHPGPPASRDGVGTCSGIRDRGGTRRLDPLPRVPGRGERRGGRAAEQRWSVHGLRSR